MKTFSDWIEEELKKRDWSRAQLSRKSGVSQATLSLIYSNQRRPGEDTCTAIAHALGYPPEVVFRAAGLLPTLPTYRQAVDEILDYKLAELTPEQREEVLQYIDWLQQRDKRSIEISKTTRQGEHPGEVVKNAR